MRLARKSSGYPLVITGAAVTAGRWEADVKPFPSRAANVLGSGGMSNILEVPQHKLFMAASKLELPRPEKRLPSESLSLLQVRALLNVPDITEANSFDDDGLTLPQSIRFNCRSTPTVLSRGRQVVKR